VFGLRMALGVFVAKGIPVGIGSAGGRGGVFAAAGVPVPGGGIATPGGAVCAGGSCPASAAGGMIVSTVASRKPAMKASTCTGGIRNPMMLPSAYWTTTSAFCDMGTCGARSSTRMGVGSATGGGGVFVARGIPVGIGSAASWGGVLVAAMIPVTGGNGATPWTTLWAASCPASAAGGTTSCAWASEATRIAAT